LLLVWDPAPVVIWIVPGTAWMATLLAVVATKVTFTVAAGVPPGPEALMVAVPAELDEINTVGVSPAASVVEGLPVIVPRLVENVTGRPTTGAPALVQWTESEVGVFKGMSTDGVGVVNAKPALLTVSACVLLVPAAVAVMTSLPPTLPVTTALS
jgi:hypothetical protein